jgi:hypothetical protein
MRNFDRATSHVVTRLAAQEVNLERLVALD